MHLHPFKDFNTIQCGQEIVSEINKLQKKVTLVANIYICVSVYVCVYMNTAFQG